MKKLISVIVPVYNEMENISLSHERIGKIAESLSANYDFELVYTDNCSTDGSFAALSAIAQQDRRVKVLRFSRNFGYQRSILTGYLAAQGDAVVQIDCDMEDPPEMIPTLIAEWESGFDIVYGIRKSRVEAQQMTILRKLFYRTIDALSEDDLPHDAGDFRLISRRVVNNLAVMRDAAPYLRGAIACMGYRQKGLPYDRDARHAGTSKFNFISNVSLAIDGIMNHSVVPLRVATYLGLLLIAASMMMSAGYFVLWLCQKTTLPPGFTTLVLLVLFSLGVQAAFLGIIGEYVGRIFKQVKMGPVTYIDQAVGLSARELEELTLKLTGGVAVGLPGNDATVRSAASSGESAKLPPK